MKSPLVFIMRLSKPHQTSQAGFQNSNIFHDCILALESLPFKHEPLR